MTERKLVLARPLVSFDLETTGLDVNIDRIVEISCIKIGVDGKREVLTRRLRPQIPISPQATKVHGISDSDVTHEPTFNMLQGQLYEFLAGCDLTGFNVEQFDVPLLAKEFERVGIVFPEPSVRVIDSWRIFLKKEPRDLSAAFRMYCGKNLEHAHSAEADAHAAAEILLAQVDRYEDLPMNIAELDAYCHPNRSDWLDSSGKVVWLDSEAVLGFGKYRHHALKTLAQQDPGYLHWMVARGSFPEDVIAIIRDALSGSFPSRCGAASNPAIGQNGPLAPEAQVLASPQPASPPLRASGVRHASPQSAHVSAQAAVVMARRAGA